MGRYLNKLINKWIPRDRGVSFSSLYREFQIILDRNNRILELMADMGDKMNGEYIFDRTYIHSACEQLIDQVFKLISDLHVFSRKSHTELFSAFDRIHREIEEELSGSRVVHGEVLIRDMGQINRDLEDEVGLKNARLGEASSALGLTVPDGFAVTAMAYREFLKHNGLDALIARQLSEIPAGDEKAAAAAGQEILERILRAEVPPALERALKQALRRLEKRNGVRPEELTLAVRSSALDEDGEVSFAGQFKTLLNVRPETLLPDYRRVLAGAYNHSGWMYRIARHPDHLETVMPVSIQRMVEATVSGTMLTLDPADSELETMLVSATWGPGASLLQDRQSLDHYRLSRLPPFQTISSRIGEKHQTLQVLPEGGMVFADTAKNDRKAPCLSRDMLESLARNARQVEQYYKLPQYIEWAFNPRGKLVILQVRPLRISLPVVDADRIEQICRGGEVVFKGKGLVAQRGVASGKAVLVGTDEDLDHFPFGAILVTRSTSPKFARLMNRAQGIITDIGSPTGHMSAIAREHRVPTLVNTGVATSLLKNGQEITLDAVHRVVYQGLVKELACFEWTEEAVFEESQEYRLLKRVLQKIAPLNLIDPHARNFKPSACRTLHDISRYIHETAVRDLIETSGSFHFHCKTLSSRLKTRLPLGLSVIDVNGGCLNRSSPIAEPSDLRCLPLIDLLKGMEESGLWTTEPISVDLGSFLSSFTRTITTNMSDPKAVNRNLAVISKEYLNLSLKLGYHYTILDAYITERINDNYIFFRFLGGVTDFSRRSRRAGFIAEVLNRVDFRTERHGDLVLGRIKKFPMDRMRQKMRILGGLIAYTRQLDVRMDRDEVLEGYLQDFFNKISGIMEV